MLKELTRRNHIKLIYIIKHKGLFAFDKAVFCVVILSNDLLIGPDSKKSMRPESYFECNYFDSYITCPRQKLESNKSQYFVRM